MRRNSLLNSLPLVAKALGDKMGVSVQIGGNEAWADGKIINIPSLPEDNREATLMGRGFLDHEAGHIRHTDLSVVPFQLKTINHKLWNALEDVRIENLMGKAFPGCRINLENLLAHLVIQGKMAFPEEGEIPAASALVGWLLSKLRYEVLGQAAFKPVYEDGQEIMGEIFPPHLMAELEKLADEGKTLASTKEAVKLTEKILNTLQDWADNPPPPPQQNTKPDPQEDDSEESESSGSDTESGPGKLNGAENGQAEEDNSNPSGSNSGTDSSQGDTPDTSSDADDDGESGSSETDGGNDSSAGDAGGSKSGSDDNAAGNGGVQDDQGKPDSSEADAEDQTSGQGAGRGAGEDVADAIRQILSAGEEAGQEWDLGSLLQRELNESAENCSCPTLMLPGEEQPRKGMVDLVAVRQTTAALRARLAGLVQSSRHQISFPKPSGRRVDSRYLSRLACKDPRVFAAKLEQTAVNTAVMVLLDRSGSMHGPKIQVAKDAVLAAALALDAIPGVSVASAAFPGRTSHGGIETITPLTRFGQSVRGTTAHYGIGVAGGTPLAEALWWTATQVLGRSEPRKIVLVATDGDPDNPEATYAVIRRLEAEGVEVLGLGICSQHVRHYFQTWEIIHKVNDLPQAMFGMLQKKLVAKAS